jgi:FHA domain
LPKPKKAAKVLKPVKKAAPSEAAKLRARIAKALKIKPAEVELRALRELAATLPSEEVKPAAKQQPSSSYLPRRLYLAMDGRGLDGRGMPFEVIDLPCIIGSSKRASVWINSPQIETNHLRITQSDDGWLIEDLGTEHGTFLAGKRIKRRVMADGDEFQLAGYLRLRAELR